MTTPIDITFDGTDYNEQGQLYTVTPLINIWRDWGNRTAGIVAVVPHGAHGKLLERRGQRCKVEVSGKVGFVTFWFVKELKAGWLEGRKAEMAPSPS